MIRDLTERPETEAKAYTLQELADAVQGDVEGDPHLRIRGVRGLSDAQPGDISFLANTKYFHQLQNTRASAVVIGKEEMPAPIPMIRVKNPNYAFAQIADLLLNKPIEARRGIHPAAIIGNQVKIGRNVAIHPYAVISDHAVIGDNTEILPFTYVGHYARIGSDCLLYSSVTIRERCELGNRVVVHAGTVIGSDGFGYHTEKGVHQKIKQIGFVQVGDDVEIGANVAIDRARFGVTSIGAGTKIDNLVQIAHNVQIGKHCLIISQAGIAGSAKLGNSVVVAGQAGVSGHIQLGDNVQIGGQSGVNENVPSDTQVIGAPAIPVKQFMRLQMALRHLPDMAKELKDLRKRISELEPKSANPKNGK